MRYVEVGVHLLHGVHKLKIFLFQVVTCPNASFTDLAEIVSRIEPVKPALVNGKSSDTLAQTLPISD